MTKEYYQAHKAERAAYYKKWREENAEKIKEKRHLYYLNNKDIIVSKTKTWKEDNPNKTKEHNKDYKVRHREEITQKMRVFRQTRKGRATQLAQHYAYHDNISERGNSSITHQWIIDNIFNFFFFFIFYI